MYCWDPDDLDDTIWAKEVQSPNCVGVFLCVTAKNIFVEFKRKGVSWKSACRPVTVVGLSFQPTIMRLADWLKKKRNVSRVGKTLLVHDKASGWVSDSTQKWLERHISSWSWDRGFIPKAHQSAQVWRYTEEDHSIFPQTIRLLSQPRNFEKP